MQVAIDKLRPGLSHDERELVSTLADGAPGRALAFAEAGAAGMYRDIVEILNGLPRLDSGRLFAFAEKNGKLAVESGIRLFSTLIMKIGERVLRGAFEAGSVLTSEALLMRKLRSAIPLENWVQLLERLRQDIDRAEELNLDKKHLILATFFAIEESAQR